MSKKIISMLLALVMIIGLVPAAAVTAFAASAEVADVPAKGKAGPSMDWSYNGGGLLVFTGKGALADNATPEQEWHKYSKFVTEVRFPKGLTAVGKDLFKAADFPNLRTVFVEDIDSWLGVQFAGGNVNPLSIAHNLAVPNGDGGIDLAKNLTLRVKANIPDGAFQNAVLGDVVIEPDVKYIGANAFAGSSVKNVTISAHADVGPSAFSGCKDLASVTVTGDGDIGSNAFAGCNALKTVDMSASGATRIEDSAFKDCVNLQTVKFPSKLQSIWDSAFENCNDLRSLDLPTATLTDIGANAFKNCNTLSHVAFPAVIQSVGANAFSGCTGIKSIEVSDLGNWCRVNLNGTSPLAYGDTLYLNDKTDFSLHLPADLITLSDYTFYNAKNIKKVYLSERMERLSDIPEHAFEGSGIEEVVFTSHEQKDLFLDTRFPGCKWSVDGTSQPENPPAENSCGNDLFWEISKDGTVLRITGNGNTIEGATWKNAYKKDTAGNLVVDSSKQADQDAKLAKITHLILPANIQTIKDTAAFNKLTGLNLVETADLGKFVEIDFGGLELMDGCNIAENGKHLGAHITIPDGPKKISANAFKGSLISSVDIPNTVTVIEDSAFANCETLSKVSNSTNLRTIGNNAFSYCSQLDDFIIPDSVRTIGDKAFYKVKRMINLTMGTNVETIGTEAFAYCANILSVDLPNTLTKLGRGAFANCISLAKVSPSRSLERIEDDTFLNCSKLEDMYVPAAVRYIGDSAFDGCSALWKIVVDNVDDWAVIQFAGKNPLEINGGSLYVKGQQNPVEDLVLPEIAYVGAHQFAGCSTITSVTIPDTVQSIGEAAFDDCTNLKEVYVKSETWSKLEPNIGGSNDPLINAHKNWIGGPDEPTKPEEILPNEKHYISEDLVGMLTGLIPCKTTAYKVGNSYKIGYGTPSKKGATITPTQAKDTLRDYLGHACYQIWDTVYKLGIRDKSAQLDALASFTFFNGSGWIKDTTGPLYTAVANHTLGNGFIEAIVAQGSPSGQPNIRLLEANLYTTGRYSAAVPGNFAYVILDPNGGISTMSSVQGYDTKASAYVNPDYTPVWKNNEYDFLGWYTKKDGGSKVITLDESTAGKTLYAHWQLRGSGVEDGVIVGRPVNYHLPALFASEISRVNPAASDLRVRVFANPVEQKNINATNHINVLSPNDVLNIVAEYRTPDGHQWVQIKESGWVDMGTNPSYSVEFGTVKLDDKQQLPVNASKKDKSGNFLPQPDLSPDAKIVGSLHNGDSVSIVKRYQQDDITWGYTVFYNTSTGTYSSGWTRLAFVDMEGAANNDDTPEKPEEPEDDGMVLMATGITQVNGRVNARKNPRMDSTVWTKIPDGTKVNIYDYAYTNGHKWCLTDDGWVCMDYVRIIEEFDQTKPEDDKKPEQEGSKEDTSGNVGTDDNKTVLASGYVFNNVSLTVRRGPGNAYQKYPAEQNLKGGSRVHVYQTKMYNGVQWGRIDPTSDPSNQKWACMSYVALDGGVEIKNPEKPAEPEKKPVIAQGIIANCSTGVNVRASATPHSAFQGVIPVGTVVELLETTDKEGVDWHRTGKGWICGLYVQKVDNPVPPVNPTPGTNNNTPGTVTPGAAQSGIVIGNRDVNVRVLPGVFGHAVVTTLRPGAGVKIYDQQEVDGALWYKIDQGWIAGQYVQLGGANNGGGIGTTQTTGGQYATGTVLERGLPILAGAGNGYKSTGKYDYGSTVTVLEQKMIDGVSFGRTDKGWVNMKFLSMNGTGITGTGTPGTVVKCAHSINVRNAPNGVPIGNLRLGSRVEILEVSDLGGGVQWGRTPQGWVSMNYIQTDAPITQPTVPVAPQPSESKPTEPEAKPEGKPSEKEGFPFTVDGKIAKDTALKFIPGVLGDADAKLTAGTAVKVRKIVKMDGRVWALVDGGWIDAADMTIATFVVPNAAQLVYATAAEGKAIGALNKGQQVKIEALDVDAANIVWGQVTVDPMGTGYIQLNGVSRSDSFSTDFIAKATVKADETVNGGGIFNDVTSGGQDSSGNPLPPVVTPETEPAVVKIHGKVYESPSYDAATIGTPIAAGEGVTINKLDRDTKGDIWCHVGSGWMPKASLDISYKAYAKNSVLIVWAEKDLLTFNRAAGQGEEANIVDIDLNSNGIPVAKILSGHYIALSEVTTTPLN